MSDLVQYGNLLNEIKDRIRQAQVKAVLSVNAEMIRMYWDIGRMIDQRQKIEGWGAGVVPRLAKDIQNDISEVKGFSERNIKRMLAFYRFNKKSDTACGTIGYRNFYQPERATACFPNPMGTQHNAYGKSQRSIHSFLVYGANHSKRLEP